MNDNYIKDVVFKNKEQLYNSLADLSNKIKKIQVHDKPFIIEICGSARSGKSTSIELIVDVLRKNNLNVLVVDEEKVKITKSINENREQKLSVNSLEYTNNVIKEKVAIYDRFCVQDVDIIIFDRGINDEFIWLNTFGAKSKELDQYECNLKNRKVDLLIILTCDAETSVKRKYLNSLSIMPSKWTNIEICNDYLESMEAVKSYFEKHSNKIIKIDSSNEDKIMVALKICNKIIDEMQ